MQISELLLGVTVIQSVFPTSQADETLTSVPGKEGMAYLGPVMNVKFTTNFEVLKKKQVSLGENKSVSPKT